MRKLTTVTGILFSVCILSGYAVPAFSAGSILYSGCGIVKKAFMAELAKKFTEINGIEVDVKGGGATLGIRNAAAGKTDVGGSCRHKLLVSEETEAKLHHVAWDAIAVIVNKENPVGTITLDQLKQVIEGKIKGWGDLGGPADTQVEFYARQGKISGVGLMARELIFHDSDKDFAATEFFKSSGPLEKAVEQNKWAIGLTGISSARKRDVKILKLNGIDISKENIAAGKYLLYRPLYLITKGEPEGLAKQFVDFAKSERGQKIISQQGTVNLKEGARLWPLYRKQMRNVMLKKG